MLAPEVAHNTSAGFMSQLVVLGQFSLAENSHVLLFSNGLYGREKTEQLVKMSATRQSDGKKHILELTPEAPSGELNF